MLNKKERKPEPFLPDPEDKQKHEREQKAICACPSEAKG